LSRKEILSPVDASITSRKRAMAVRRKRTKQAIPVEDDSTAADAKRRRYQAAVKELGREAELKKTEKDKDQQDVIWGDYWQVLNEDKDVKEKRAATATTAFTQGKQTGAHTELLAGRVDRALFASRHEDFETLEEERYRKENELLKAERRALSYQIAVRHMSSGMWEGMKKDWNSVRAAITNKHVFNADPSHDCLTSKCTLERLEPNKVYRDPERPEEEAQAFIATGKVWMCPYSAKDHKCGSVSECGAIMTTAQNEYICQLTHTFLGMPMSNVSNGRPEMTDISVGIKDVRKGRGRHKGRVVGQYERDLELSERSGSLDKKKQDVLKTNTVLDTAASIKRERETVRTTKGGAMERAIARVNRLATIDTPEDIQRLRETEQSKSRLFVPLAIETSKTAEALEREDEEVAERGLYTGPGGEENHSGLYNEDTRDGMSVTDDFPRPIHETKAGLDASTRSLVRESYTLINGADEAALTRQLAMERQNSALIEGRSSMPALLLLEKQAAALNLEKTLESTSVKDAEAAMAKLRAERARIAGAVYGNVNQAHIDFVGNICERALYDPCVREVARQRYKEAWETAHAECEKLLQDAKLVKRTVLPHEFAGVIGEVVASFVEESAKAESATFLHKNTDVVSYFTVAVVRFFRLVLQTPRALAMKENSGALNIRKMAPALLYKLRDGIKLEVFVHPKTRAAQSCAHLRDVLLSKWRASSSLPSVTTDADNNSSALIVRDEETRLAVPLRCSPFGQDVVSLRKQNTLRGRLLHGASSNPGESEFYSAQQQQSAPQAKPAARPKSFLERYDESGEIKDMISPKVVPENEESDSTTSSPVQSAHVPVKDESSEWIEQQIREEGYAQTTIVFVPPHPFLRRMVNETQFADLVEDLKVGKIMNNSKTIGDCYRSLLTGSYSYDNLKQFTLDAVMAVIDHNATGYVVL
jgi:hypothetical protein